MCSFHRELSINGKRGSFEKGKETGKAAKREREEMMATMVPTKKKNHPKRTKINSKNSLGDNAVEGRSLEVEGLARLANALLACEEGGGELQEKDDV